eukprot:3625485-Amphidinium_carterae.3
MQRGCCTKFLHSVVPHYRSFVLNQSRNDALNRTSVPRGAGGHASTWHEKVHLQRKPESMKTCRKMEGQVLKV